MQYPNIPNKVSFRKVIYGFNVFLVISGISAGIVFINGESLQEALLGVLCLIPPVVAHTMAVSDPEQFYYMWNGMYDLMKLPAIALYIVGVTSMFRLEQG